MRSGSDFLIGEGGRAAAVVAALAARGGYPLDGGGREMLEIVAGQGAGGGAAPDPGPDPSAVMNGCLAVGEMTATSDTVGPLVEGETGAAVAMIRHAGPRHPSEGHVIAEGGAGAYVSGTLVLRHPNEANTVSLHSANYEPTPTFPFPNAVPTLHHHPSISLPSPVTPVPSAEDPAKETSSSSPAPSTAARNTGTASAAALQTPSQTQVQTSSSRVRARTVRFSTTGREGGSGGVEGGLRMRGRWRRRFGNHGFG